MPSRPCETVFSEIQANLDSLEWVPYYDPFDENTPPHRRIEENPITFQNMWAGGARFPTDIPSAPFRKLLNCFQMAECIYVGK